MCGEQRLLLPEQFILPGSPPRVRGTASDSNVIGAVFRITPACAGNSFSSIRNYNQDRDHPRVCGEQFAGIGKNMALGGSPPRVRGTASGICTVTSIYRITPACAGNSIHLRLSSL